MSDLNLIFDIFSRGNGDEDMAANFAGGNGSGITESSGIDLGEEKRVVGITLGIRACFNFEDKLAFLATLDKERLIEL